MLTSTIATPTDDAISDFRVGDDPLAPKARLQATRAARARNASGRRRLIDPTTCDRDYSARELEFMEAIQEYKRASGRMFPTWSEVLGVVHGLGYAKAAGR